MYARALVFVTAGLLACGSVAKDPDAGDQVDGDTSDGGVDLPDAEATPDADTTPDADPCYPLLACGEECVDPLEDVRYCGASGTCSGESDGLHCGVDTPVGDDCDDGFCIGARELIVNGGFETDLTGWLTADNPANPGVEGGHDPEVVFAWINPGYASGGSSGGPAARQLYQDFVVPYHLTSATFSFVHFQEGTTQDLDPENVLAIEKDPMNESDDFPENAYRVDLVDPNGTLFYESILFELYLPDALPEGTSAAMAPISVFSPELLEFLQAHEGQSLRLRIGHVESTFPWQSGIDTISLVVIGQ